MGPGSTTWATSGSVAATDGWVALFCPHCGATVNEGDLETDEDEPVVNRGSSYTCGWCGERQTDWNHVKRCRATYGIRKAQADERARIEYERARVEQAADLVELRGELQYG
jgi:predicted RNA-binding Zn-ribbon protein involved in translation (DUF1610 family)